MKNIVLIILITLFFGNCQKKDVDCIKKESYLEKCKIFGKVKSIKSRVFELNATENEGFEKGKEKLVFFGHRYDKEISPSGYLLSWTNYQNGSNEIKTKNVYTYNGDNIKLSEFIYDKDNKITFKRIIKVKDNLTLNMIDYNEDGEIEAYYENKLNDLGKISKQIQYKDINKEQIDYLTLYEYKNCEISKFKTLDGNNEMLYDQEYEYENGEIIYHLSKDKTGLNSYEVRKNILEAYNFESVKKDKNGEVISEKLVWTDKFHNEIKEIENKGDTLEKMYTYDNYNNWISMKIFKNSKPIEIVIRNFEYYK